MPKMSRIYKIRVKNEAEAIFIIKEQQRMNNSEILDGTEWYTQDWTYLFTSHLEIGELKCYFEEHTIMKEQK